MGRRRLGAPDPRHAVHHRDGRRPRLRGSRPVFSLLDRLAGLPDPDRPAQAVALAAGFSLVTAYLNWALCLVACALFVPFVFRRNPKPTFAC